MMLAGNLLDRTQESYAQFYNRHQTGKRLLDNGAWESETVQPHTLLELGTKYLATEIIAPDILNEPWVTLPKTELFLARYKQECERLYTGQGPRWVGGFNIAAVAHGHTVKEAQAFVKHVSVLNILYNPYKISTIAIGRAFSRTVGDAMARYELASWIKQEYGDIFEIHLLGYNDDWPGELTACDGIVRSMDTAAPFTAALAHRALDSIGVPRPHDYFQTEAKDYDYALVEHNIEVLDEWAGAEWRTNR
jgi:hypothetical protein